MKKILNSENYKYTIRSSYNIISCNAQLERLELLLGNLALKHGTSLFSK